MSEWEQFSAYRPIIQDAKREERERIIQTLKENYTNDEDDWAIDWAIDIVKGLENR